MTRPRNTDYLKDDCIEQAAKCIRILRQYDDTESREYKGQITRLIMVIRRIRPLQWLKRSLSNEGDSKDIQAYARMLNAFKKSSDIEYASQCLDIIIAIAQHAKERLERYDAEDYIVNIF